MDPVTHGLTGAVIARAGFSRGLGKWGPVTGVFVSLSPDADFILRLAGMEAYLRYHRGFTHSVILLPVLSLIWALFLRRFFKDQSLPFLYLFCFVILTSHIIMDLITSFGTMILTPFSDQRLSWDIVFIVDLYFTAILLVPFLLTLYFRSYSRILAAGSIVLLISYSGLCLINHNSAMAMAHRIVEEKGLSPSSVAALPQPFTPFKWVLLIDTEETLFQNFININNNKENIQDNNRVWKKWPDSLWVEKARELPGVKFFMWFARFPVAIKSEIEGEGHLVEFIDLRFDILRGRIPFTHRVEFDKDGIVVMEKFTTINSFFDNHGRR